MVMQRTDGAKDAPPWSDTASPESLTEPLADLRSRVLDGTYDSLALLNALARTLRRSGDLL